MKNTNALPSPRTTIQHPANRLLCERYPPTSGPRGIGSGYVSIGQNAIGSLPEAQQLLTNPRRKQPWHLPALFPLAVNAGLFGDSRGTRRGEANCDGEWGCMINHGN